MRHDLLIYYLATSPVWIVAYMYGLIKFSTWLAGKPGTHHEG